MKPSFSNTSSSYYQFQQSLDQYIYFSPLTTGGSSGRAVKIHKDLFLPFFCIVDPTTYDGQSIIRHIENLRTTCTIVRKETGSGYANNPRESTRHKSQLAKVNSAFHQVLIIKNLHVHYRVSQEQGDKAPSVYISSIRVVNSGTNESPGLYKEVKSTIGSKKVEKCSDTRIDGRTVYINDYAQNAKDAMSKARQITNDNEALLFYCPVRANDELGVFGTKEKSAITQQTINELVNIFKQNQRGSQGASWYVEGEAVNLLAHAIKQIPHDLSKHSFRLVNPIANTANVIEALSNKKAKLEGEFFKYDRNRTALIALGTQKDKILQAIGKLPAGKNYDRITRRYILQSINEMSSTGERANNQQAKLGSITKTFIQLIKAAGVYRK